MKDFTIIAIENLLSALKAKTFLFYSITDYLNKNTTDSQIIFLRHDVEARYENALRIAEIQYHLKIKGTYYFRFVGQSINLKAINKIADMGHEIGYHYDDLSACNGNYEDAILRFESNLRILNEIAPIRTICMEGNPLSIYNNHDLWKKFNYRDFGILVEPYLDLDFNNIFYLTDTGRRWDGERFNVRDKVEFSNEEFLKYSFHTTNDIIKAIEDNKLPNKVMMTFHPQRWTDNRYLWFKELIWQNMKNKIKKSFYVK